MDIEQGWGGTTLQSRVTEPVYQQVVEKRVDDMMLDATNVAAVHLLRIVAERVNNAVERILNSEFRLLITAEEDLLFDYYLSNTISLSHFEAGVYLLLTESLCYENSELGQEIVRYFNDEKEKYTVTREDKESAKRQAIVEHLATKYTRSDYSRLLEKIDAEPYINGIEELVDEADTLSNDRGSLVHDFTSLFKSSNPERVKNQATQCRKLVNLTNDLLSDELTIQEELLQMAEN
jgi:hypothetical protein